MATTSLTRKKTGCGTCETEARACPDCGGLECLCRPRFFAGQLLSETDLNRLDSYIMKKQRLHNRYLHGWGVVCGLKVGCDSCNSAYVQVTPGYALSPCGDDIVVCETDHVNICELIKRCRDAARKDNCRPYGASPDCKDGEETWILAIRYQETPSRGVTALRGLNNTCHSCGSSCGCDGACGCGGNKTSATTKTTSKQRQAPRAAPQECEATLVCEGYRYELFKAPDKDINQKDDKKQRGALLDKFYACLEDLLALLEFAPTPEMTQQQRYQACCRIKKQMMNYLQEHRITDCRMYKELQTIVCPNPNLPEDQFNAQMDQAGIQAMIIIYRLMIACLCDTLLPPCPEASDETRVPLAAITVRCNPCEVVRICNWTTYRKFATTFPNLQYWLSWLPFGRQLRDAIESLCCSLADRFDGSIKIDESAQAANSINNNANAVYGGNYEAIMARPDMQSPYQTRSQDFADIGIKAFTNDKSKYRIDTFMRGLKRIPASEREKIFTDVERDNPAEFLMLNILAQPILSQALGGAASSLSDGIMGKMGGISSLFSMVGKLGANRDVSDLQNQVGDLKRELAELRSQVNKKK